MIWSVWFCLLFVVAAIWATGDVNPAKRSMGWLCLEFCGEDSATTQSYLDEWSRHQDIMSALSFERYQLGPNATLVRANVTEIVGTLHEMGVKETWPMLSSYPHPPEFIEWMRDAFANVESFTEQCVTEAKKYNYTGYNLDWEPTEGVLDSDAADYAAFIDAFATGLHQHGLKLQVDVAQWGSPFVWDYDLIAETAADYMITMGTYTSSDASFSDQLNLAVSGLPLNKLGVGLEMVNASTGGHIPIDEVAWRFNQIEAAGVKEIDIWKFPVPAGWWPLLDEFMRT